MIDLCEDIGNATTKALRIRGLDAESAEPWPSYDPDNPRANSVPCGRFRDSLKGAIVSSRAIGLDLHYVRLEDGESREEWLERFHKYEPYLHVKAKVVPEYGGHVWMAKEVDLPEKVNITTYAFSGEYMVRIFVGIQAVEKGEDKAEKRCLDTSMTLVRSSFTALAA